MVGQTIVSDIFKKQTKMGVQKMSQLLVRGGGIQINDALNRLGWSNDEPVLTTVLSCEIDSGVVRACRFETRGDLGTILFGAKELWPNAQHSVSVSINLGDLSVITWPMAGDNRNQSAWIDDEDLEVTYKQQDGTVLESANDLS